MDLHAVLFELDGVLVVTDRYELQAWHALCRERSWTFSGRRGSDSDTLAALLSENGVAEGGVDREELLREKEHRYLHAVDAMESEDFFPGAVGFVIELRAFEIPTAIATRAPGAERVIAAMDMAELFDTIVTGDPREQSAAAVLKAAAENLGVEPRGVVVFADSDETLAAARAVGMTAVGLGPADRVGEANLAVQNFSDIDFAEFLAEGVPV